MRQKRALLTLARDTPGRPCAAAVHAIFAPCLDRGNRIRLRLRRTEIISLHSRNTLPRENVR
jgi:hypothetical protein